MRKVVAHQFQRGDFVFHGVDRNGAVDVNWPLQIPMGAVHSGRDCLFGQAAGDIGGHGGGGDASVIVACIAVGKCQGDLGHLRHPRLFSAYQAPGCGLCGA